VSDTGNKEYAMFEAGFVAGLQIPEIVGAALQPCCPLNFGGTGFVDVPTVGVVVLSTKEIRYTAGDIDCLQRGGRRG
jgi:hypothetical protein